MEVEVTMLSKISQTQREKYIICGLFVYVWGCVETEWGITKGQGGAGQQEWGTRQENMNGIYLVCMYENVMIKPIIF